jgi:hypothetical protein
MSDGIFEASRMSREEEDRKQTLLESILEWKTPTKEEGACCILKDPSEVALDWIRRLGEDPKEWLKLFYLMRSSPGVFEDPASFWMRLKAISPYADATILWCEHLSNVRLVGEVERHLRQLGQANHVETVSIDTPEGTLKVFVLRPALPRIRHELPDI